MFEVIVLLLFAWLLIKAIKLFFKMTWGTAKLLAIILLIAACPTFLGILMIASGLALLFPFALAGIAVAVLKILNQ